MSGQIEFSVEWDQRKSHFPILFINFKSHVKTFSASKAAWRQLQWLPKMHQLLKTTGRRPSCPSSTRGAEKARSSTRLTRAMTCPRRTPASAQALIWAERSLRMKTRSTHATTSTLSGATGSRTSRQCLCSRSNHKRRRGRAQLASCGGSSSSAARRFLRSLVCLRCL